MSTSESEAPVTTHKEPICGEPCPPKDACEECEFYWHEMRQKGLWTDEGGWTKKGWRSIVSMF